MFKRITALILCLMLLFSFVSCGKKDKKNGSDKNQKPSVSTPDSPEKGEDKSDPPTKEEEEYLEEFKTNVFYSGSPVAPGDVYTLPDIAPSASAPVLAEITAHAKPDDTITVMGEGFSGGNIEAYAYSQSTASDGKATKLSLSVADNTTANITINKSLAYGIYGIYFTKGGNKSNVLLVNEPKIWWLGITKLTAGEELKIFGENLTTDNGDRAYVYLLDPAGKYMRLDVNYADPYKITAKIPDTLQENVAYKVMIHSGHGGSFGFATIDEPVYYSKTPTVQFKGNKIDVTDFGANIADDGGDDTAAIEKAINAANSGDTLYFPQGTYMITRMITITKSLKMQGDGIGKSFIIVGPDVKKGAFFVKKAPMEITALEVWDVRNKKLSTSFIYFESFEYDTPTYNLYVHGCRFRQEVTHRKHNSSSSVLQVHSSTQIIIEDNDFECTTAIFTYMVEKLYFNNNRYTGTFYNTTSGVNENATLIWATNGLESYGNTFYAKDKPTDKAVEMQLGDRGVARLYALQMYNNHTYIARNKSVNTGILYDNQGEQIMYETGSSYYDGAISSCTEKSLTVPKALDGKYKKAQFTFVITAGKGMGQYRHGSSYNGKTINFDEPLKILPDSTSKVLVFYQGAVNAAVYKNNFDCFTNANKDTSATCGVQAYSTNINFFVTDNYFANMTYGIQLTPHFSDSDAGGLNNGLYWFLVDGNQFRNTGAGIRFNLPMSDTSKRYRAAMAVLIRRNEFNNCPQYTSPREGYPGGTGISVGEYNEKGNIGDWIYGTVIENNSFKGCALYDVYLYKYQNFTYIRNNSSSHGTLKIAAASGANGIKTLK